MKKSVFVAGSGGIGEAVAILLREWSDYDVEIFLGDVNEANLSNAKSNVVANSTKGSRVETVLMLPEGISEAMRSAFENCDALLDCSPGAQAPRMARFAKDFKMHYANLTEYVAETDSIVALARNTETGFILQTGLAPGLINVLAMSLYQEFLKSFGVEKVERIGMKVGALTNYAHAPHYYGLTWSPIGVATEYVKSARAIRNFEPTELPALSELERIIIGGDVFEADLTSGGAADLPDYFRGIARSLDYKTLRHQGHFDWAKNQIKHLPNDDSRPAKLLEILRREVPYVDDDLVVAYASVEGFDASGIRRRLEKSFRVSPLEINGKTLRAIQVTTAAPLAESCTMLLTRKLKGVILQSQIPCEEFLNGRFISRIFGK